MDKNEAWRFPDGSQLSWTALNQMGMTPGDVGEIMRQMYRDPDTEAIRNLGLKGTSILKDDATQDANQDHLDELRETNERVLEQQRQEQGRLDEQRRMEQKMADEKFQEKKEAEERLAAEKRPQQDALNMSLLSLPLGLASFGLGLGLGKEVLQNVGGMMSGAVNSMNNPMMVASNNGGGLLAMARGAFDILGPGTDKDIQLKGPGLTSNFTPGAPAPEFDMAEGVAPNSPMKKMGMGLSGPSLMPPGMN